LSPLPLDDFHRLNDLIELQHYSDRSSLNKFSEKMMPLVEGKPFEHVMLVQGT
jgi:hypothetical protein